MNLFKLNDASAQSVQRHGTANEVSAASRYRACSQYAQHHGTATGAILSLLSAVLSIGHECQKFSSHVVR